LAVITLPIIVQQFDARIILPCVEQKKLSALITMLKADPKIFVAYEDSDSFSAISKSDGFPEQVSRIPNQEKMDAFSFSGFWEEQSWCNAVKAAIGADIIIVSLSGHADLPIPVRRWMENLPNCEQKNHPMLVVLFVNDQIDDSKRNVLIYYFQQIAKNHGLDFLCNCDGPHTFPTSPQSSETANQMDKRTPKPSNERATFRNRFGSLMSATPLSNSI
jgi:hypothetical protein